MADISRTPAASAGSAPGPAVARPRPAVSRDRPATRARREFLRELREQLVSGAYEPPVDAVSAELAAWLLCDGLPDRARS